MTPLADAQRDVLAAMAPLPEVEVSLREARGLVLSGPVAADHPIPPFDNSAMDGYAVRAEDTVEAPVVLTVLEDVPAGSVATLEIGAGQAIKIMTGAPLPAGCDAVVKVEDTEPDAAAVRVLVPVEMGTAVRRAGGDVAAGTVVLEPGDPLTPAAIGVLASLGHHRPRVRRRPTVAVMSTGDEVVPPDTPQLEPGKIRDSNRPMLRGLLEELGVVVLDFGIVPDDAPGLRKVLAHAAREADAVVTSGGVSMGEYDLVKQVLRDLGDIEFWRVAMQPAKPFAFGLLGGTPLFGLPGNPVSVAVAFEQFVRPGLLRMMGASAIFRPRVQGVLDDTVRTDPAKTVFLRVAARYAGGEWRATLSGGQGSNILSALAAADAFAVVPRGVGNVEPGTALDLEMFRWPASRTAEEALGEPG